MVKEVPVISTSIAAMTMFLVDVLLVVHPFGYQQIHDPLVHHYGVVVVVVVLVVAVAVDVNLSWPLPKSAGYDVGVVVASRVVMISIHDYCHWIMNSYH